MKPLRVEDGRPLKVKERFLEVEEAIRPTVTFSTTRVVSVDTRVGPRGAVGETCHILLRSRRRFSFRGRPISWSNFTSGELV